VYDPRQADARPWLFGISTNLLRHWFRAAARGALPGAGHEHDFADDALGRVEARALGRELAAALAAVPGLTGTRCCSTSGPT
jgi:RNA polymerase sigma-70 factor (ECF subfamily)